MSRIPTTVRLTPEDLQVIVGFAEAAYPEECCGLLSGAEEAGVVQVDGVHESENLAEEPARRFEVDPALRLRLQRTLRGSGRGVVGIYHSHPDGPARPSPRDLDAAWEPDLVWLIIGVRKGQFVQSTAHVLVAEGDETWFVEVPLVTSDSTATSGRKPSEGGGSEL